MIIDANSWKIDKLLSILLDLRNRAQKENKEEALFYIEMTIEIVKEWKHDNLLYDFRNDHYRQAVSFLMRISEETPKDEIEQAEYFQDRFYETLKNYEALENKYKERKRRKQ